MASENEIKIIVEAEVNKALRDLKKFERGAEKGAKKSAGAFSKLKVAIAGVGTVLAGSLAIAFKKSIQAASDFEEANQKFGVTFRGVSKEANKLRKELVKSFNLSNKAATELLSNTGDLLSGFGFSGEAALELSGEVNKLAADLSSFANVPIEQASQAISKGLLGERESMKSLGIAIGEADVKQRLFEKGQQGLEGMALKQARAQATLELAYEQSGNAIGDSARSSDSFANIMRTISNLASDLSIAIGQDLIDRLKPFAEALRDAGKAGEGLNKVAVAARSIAFAISVATATLTIFFNAFQTLFSPLVNGIQGLIGAYDALTQKNLTLKERLGALKTVFKKEFNDIGKDVKTNLGDAGDAIKKVFTDLASIFEKGDAIAGLENFVDAGADAGRKTGKAIGKGIKDGTKEALVSSEFKKAFDEIAGFARDSFGAINDLTASIFDRQLQELERAREKALEGQNTFQQRLNEINEQEKMNNELDLKQEVERAKIAGDEKLAAEKEQQLERTQLEEQAKKKEEEINAEFDRKIRESKKRAAVADKANAIAQSVIQTSLAVVSTLAQTPGGPISRTAAAAIIGGLGAVQTAAIAAQPIPRFLGGIDFVPRDRMPALLDEGERVLTKEENNNFNNSFDGNIVIQGVSNPEEFAGQLNDYLKSRGAVNVL